MFTCNGILFNHESPRRGETFVTRKITMFLAKKILGSKEILYLGNLNAKRDWGHAKDYVEVQWMMLQKEKPTDYVIGTGRMETVRRFCELTGNKLGWNKSCENGIIWENKGLNEIGRRADNGEIVIKIDPRYYRPTDVDELMGDASYAKKILNCFIFCYVFYERLSKALKHLFKFS